MKLELVGQGAVFFDTDGLLFWLGVEEVHDHGVERLFDDQEAGLVDHLKVLEEAVSEEVVDYVETVLISIIGVIAWKTRASGLYHAYYLSTT